MLKVLSTSSSELGRSALPWTILFVVLVEVIAVLRLPSRMSNHEVDDTLAEITSKTSPAEVVLLGDSVGRQFFRPYKGDPRFAALATNEAIETAGNYYMLERYLRTHPAPRTIVYMGNPLTLRKNLDPEQLTENYVQRVFTRWNEIAELAVARRSPALASSRSAMPSSRPRSSGLVCKRCSAGRTTPGHSRPPHGPRETTRSRGQPHGLFEILHAYLMKRRTQPIAEEYFSRIVDLAESKHARVVFVPRPLSEKRARDFAPLMPAASEVLRTLARERPNFEFRERATRTYPDSWFFDGVVHLRDDKLYNARRNLAPFLPEIGQPRR